MTQENKQLLLKDLCTRLPYGVKCKYYDFYENIYDEGTIRGFEREEYIQIDGVCIHIEEIKPYLRPLSSLTEEEQEILEDFGVTISPFSGQIRVPFNDMEFPFITMQKIISYLYSIHIDINGLIPKGLAIEVTKDNNPYK